MGNISITQAIQISIDSIKQRKDLPQRKQEEAIRIMENFLEQDWYIKWDRQMIIDTLKNFKTRTGKAPTVTDLSERGMPKNITIQSNFHMSASLFLKQLFPENRENKKNNNIYGFETEKDWLNCFIEQFEKHKTDGMCYRKYDLLRDKGTPTWNTIARHCGNVSWSELVKKAGVNTDYKKRIKTATNIHIANTTSPTIEKIEAINKQRKELNLELYNILTNKKR